MVRQRSDAIPRGDPLSLSPSPERERVAVVTPEDGAHDRLNKKRAQSITEANPWGALDEGTKRARRAELRGATGTIKRRKKRRWWETIMEEMRDPQNVEVRCDMPDPTHRFGGGARWSLHWDGVGGDGGEGGGHRKPDGKKQGWQGNGMEMCEKRTKQTKLGYGDGRMLWGNPDAG